MSDFGFAISPLDGTAFLGRQGIDRNAIDAIGLIALAFVCLVLVLVLWRRERGPRMPVAHLRSDATGALLSIAETANLIVGRIDVNGRFQWISPNVHSILGIAPQEFVSGRRTFDEFVHDDDRASLIAAARHRRQGRRDRLEFQYRLRAPDGTWRWFHERQGPVPGMSGPPLSWEIVAVDLTDRRRADEQQRQALLLQQLSTRILESFLQTEDLDATTGGALSMLAEHFGIARASYIQLDTAAGEARLVSEWLAPGTPSAIDRRRLISAESVDMWMSIFSRGVPLSLTRGDEPLLSRPDLAGRMDPDVQSLLCVPVLTGGAIRGALVLEDLNRPRRWKEEEIATMQTLAFACARGLEQLDSADARARFTALQRQLERSEVVAQLTGGIAHDFNNIMFAISGHVELLRHRAQDPETRAAFADIERVIAGASGIVSGLLQAHRGEIERPAPMDLAQELDAATKLAGRLMPRAVQVETDFAAAEGCIVRSTSQGVRQLILNLVVNARDAVKGRGAIRLSCHVETTNDLGECAVVVVEDSGQGIPEELRVQVLQPFFTTKGTAGTGLGLPLCQRVAQESGGRLRLDRSPTLGGLRVSAWFPLCPAAEPIATTKPALADEPIVTERLTELNRVLIVEDDSAVRDVLIAAFESLDVEVIARGDALGVEPIVVNGPLPIDLMVMDIDLPELSGVACVEQLRARGCMTPCLFVTGGMAEPDGALGPCRVLRKPFRLDALVLACRALLDDAKRA